MSKKKPALVDTNILIRFLTGDPRHQASQVKSVFSKAAADSIELPDLIIAELLFVLLSSVYKLPKEEVVAKIELLIGLSFFHCDRELIKLALDKFVSNSISYVDAYLFARIVLGRNSSLYSFDKKLIKMDPEHILNP